MREQHTCSRLVDPIDIVVFNLNLVAVSCQTLACHWRFGLAEKRLATGVVSHFRILQQNVTPTTT